MSSPIAFADLAIRHVGRVVTYQDHRLHVTGVLESIDARGRYAALTATPNGRRLRSTRAVVIQIDDVVIATPDLTATIIIHPQETPHV